MSIKTRASFSNHKGSINLSALPFQALESPAVEIELQTKNNEPGTNASNRTSSEEPLHVQDTYLDGGYGWVITGSGFVLCFLFVGILYAWGVIQAELSNQGLANSLPLSSIGSVSTAVTAGGCLPATWILNRLGLRYTTLLGVGIGGFSLIMAGFTTRNLGGLVVCQGALFGFAVAINFLTAYTTPSQYFLKKRGLATGIVSCGGGLGGAIWSIAIQRLIDKWGLPWTYRFLGFMCLLFGTPAALLMKEGYLAKRSRRGSVTEVERSMFQSSRFIRILIACFVASYPFFIPPFYIPQYTQSVGFSASRGALYGALFNVSSGAGRIGFGMLADFATGNINAWTTAVALIVISSLAIWPFATDQALILVFVLLCGFGSGGFFTLQSSIVGQVIGSHRVTRGIAMIEFAESFGFFAGPLSAGGLLDAFGGSEKGAGPYRPAMYLVGATTGTALLLILSVRWSTNRKLFAKV